MRPVHLIPLLCVALSLEATTPADAEQAPSNLGAEQIGTSGNWVRKREWVKQAQEVNEQLQEDLAAIQKSRAAFYEAQQSFDKSSNEFFQSKGFATGKIDELIADLQADIAREKELRIAVAKGKSESEEMPTNYYDVQIEAIEADVKRFTREVEQFKLDMKAIADVDSSLNERLKVLDKHIKQAGDLESQAAEKLSKLWWVIDHTKARTLFYEIKGHAEQIASIKKYVTGTLLSDFKKVGQTLTSHISQVQEEIKDLEERGLIVEHRAERLEQQRKDRERVEEMLRKVEEEEEVRPRRRRNRVAKRTWLQTFYAPVDFVVSSIAALGNYFLSFFVSKPAKRKARRARQ